MAEPSLSVVICTHNPRRPVLQRVVDSLHAQTTPATEWDLLIVDNGSEPPVSSFLDLGWHPRSRFLVESELGVSAARRRAVRDTETALILFVDDDNVLATDFIEKSLELTREFPHLGVFGPARIKAEFEQPPEPDLLARTELLVHYELPHDVWSNFRHGNRSVPPTAGMTVRRAVAQQWMRNTDATPLRRTLGRRGNTALIGGEDVDLSLTACDLGLGTGVFVRLGMTHVFAAKRVERAYLLRLWEGNMFSEWVLNHVRGTPQATRSRQWVQNLKDVLKLPLLGRTERQFHLAIMRGRRKARAFLKKNLASGVSDVKF